MAHDEEYWRRRMEHERLVNDVGAIRHIAESQELELRDQQPGPFELEVVTDAIERGSHQLADAQTSASGELAESVTDAIGDMMDDHFETTLMFAGAMADIQGEQTAYLRNLLHEARDTRFVLEDIQDLAGYNLIAAGAQLAISYAQLSELNDLEGRLGEIETELEFHGRLLESIDEGVWGLYDRIEDLEETVVEVGEAIIDNQVRIGEAIVQEIRLSAEQSAQLLGRHISRTSQAQTSEIKTYLAVLDERAHRRHEELVRAVSSPVHNAANEKYVQARTLYASGELSLSLRKLSDEVFEQDSTHQLGWILYGEISQRRGRPKEARAAFKRASTYAFVEQNVEIYELACLHLARLELTVGNTWHAKNVLIRAHRKIKQLRGTTSAHVAYELFKIRFAEGQRRWKEEPKQWGQAAQWRSEQKKKLRKILLLAPELRNDAAHNPLIQGIASHWGQAPFIQLFDLLEHYGEIITTDRHIKDDPIVQSFMEILRNVLYLTEAGRVRHTSRKDARREIHPSAQDVFDVLDQIQTIVVAFAGPMDADHPTSEKNADAVFVALSKVLDDHFNTCSRLFETLLLYYVDHVNDQCDQEEDPPDREYLHPETILNPCWVAWKSVGFPLPTVVVWLIEDKLPQCFSYTEVLKGLTMPDGTTVYAGAVVRIPADPDAVAWIKDARNGYSSGGLGWIIKKRPELETLLESLMRKADALR
ncbi:hypothetical protein CO174_05265 [Candidatus Uhrbacteria bacterium CG_4_9_14_3_um_filter_50_9]|uniref:Uncharacterized protein n=1 Tax=Candidatus Uhrbacteria bacterium CG_4_9_14_3_um_filter_50_9 TaxID=1975035 RepID=A0A2M7XAW9_9BACT|nr:MAG: hypothetical protein CO174_05265 [Candidatus Uhrbacteria bacterium CG_4_9_14_3_um_filter_50_9]